MTAYQGMRRKLMSSLPQLFPQIPVVGWTK